jgi:uncharacterized membrane protein
MNINKTEQQMVGFVLIVLGILSMVVSFILFNIDYRTISDLLTVIGFPSLILGCIIYAKAEKLI